MIEFAIVIGLLLYLIMGAVSFGVLLAASHGMNEAVGEAARAAALAGPTPATAGPAAARASLTSSGYDCTGGTGNAVTCKVDPPAPCVGDATKSCITVELIHDRNKKSLVGHLPLIEAVLPDTLTARATAMVSP